MGNGPTDATDPWGLKILKGKYDSDGRIAWAFVDPTHKWGLGLLVTEIEPTPDETRLIGMAGGNAKTEMKLVEILNALVSAPGDYGSLAATEAFYGFGRYAKIAKGDGWCQSWLDVVVPTLPNSRSSPRLVRVGFAYIGVGWPVYSGHGAVRLEFGSATKVTGVAYIDNGWQGGSDFIFFKLSITFGNEDPGTLWDGTLAPYAGEPTPAYWT